MAVSNSTTELVKVNVVAGTPVSCNMPLRSAAELVVRYGTALVVAVLTTDYTVALNPPNYNDFTLTPTAALITKINALGLDQNVLYLRRVTALTSDFQATDTFVREKIRDEFDRLIMRVQEINTRMTRFATLVQSTSGDLPPVIPEMLDGQVLGWEDGKFVGRTIVTTDVLATEPKKRFTVYLASAFTKTANTVISEAMTIPNLQAGKLYGFRALLFVDADTTGGHKYTVMGTVAPVSVRWQTNSIDSAAKAIVIAQLRSSLGDTASAVAGSDVPHFTWLEGSINVLTEGSLSLGFAQAAASGVSSLRVGSRWELWEM